MSVYRFRNSGVDMKGLPIHDSEVITAAAGNDGVEVDGNWVDRKGANGSEVPLSGKLIITWTAVLQDTETLTIAANLQDATDVSGTGAADYGNAFASAIVQTATADATYRGVVEIDVDLSAARGFIRDQVTADLSAAGTDTVAISAVFVLSGENRAPAT